MNLSNDDVRSLTKALEACGRDRRGLVSVLGTAILSVEDDRVQLITTDSYTLAKTSVKLFRPVDRAARIVVDSGLLLSLFKLMLAAYKGTLVPVDVTPARVKLGCDVLSATLACDTVALSTWDNVLRRLADVPDRLHDFDTITAKDAKSWADVDSVITLASHPNGRYVQRDIGKHVETITEAPQDARYAETLNTSLLVRAMKLFRAREDVRILVRAAGGVVLQGESGSVTIAPVRRTPSGTYPDTDKPYERNAW